MKILYPEVFWLFIPVLFLLLPAIMNYRRGKLHLSILAGAWRSTESIQVFFIKTLAYWITPVSVLYIYDLIPVRADLG